MESVIVGVDVHIDPLHRQTRLGWNAMDVRDAVDSVPYKGFVQIANTYAIVGWSRAALGRPYHYHTVYSIALGYASLYVLLKASLCPLW